MTADPGQAPVSVTTPSAVGVYVTSALRPSGAEFSSLASTSAPDRICTRGSNGFDGSFGPSPGVAVRTVNGTPAFTENWNGSTSPAPTYPVYTMRPLIAFAYVGCGVPVAPLGSTSNPAFRVTPSA